MLGSVLSRIKYYQLLQAERDQLLAAEATQKEEVLVADQRGSRCKGRATHVLRYQLNPISLNTLNSIYALIDQGAGSGQRHVAEPKPVLTVLP